MLSKVCHTQEVYLCQMIYNVSGQVYQHPLYWMTIPMSDDISFPWASFLMYFPLKEWTYVRWYTMAVGNCINIYYLEWLHLCQMIYHFRGQVSWCMSHPEGELISDDIQCQWANLSTPTIPDDYTYVRWYMLFVSKFPDVCPTQGVNLCHVIYNVSRKIYHNSKSIIFCRVKECVIAA